MYLRPILLITNDFLSPNYEQELEPMDLNSDIYLWINELSPCLDHSTERSDRLKSNFQNTLRIWLNGASDRHVYFRLQLANFTLENTILVPRLVIVARICLYTKGVAKANIRKEDKETTICHHHLRFN